MSGVKALFKTEQNRARMLAGMFDVPARGMVALTPGQASILLPRSGNITNALASYLVMTAQSNKVKERTSVMKRIRVALFSSRAEAATFSDRLMEAGIAATIHDELGLAIFWFVSKTATGTRLEVPAEQAEKANQFLYYWAAAPEALPGAIRCPECKSLRVDYPQFARRSILPNVLMGLIAGVGLLEKQFYCEDCHWMWPKQHINGRRHRRHMAPDYFLD
jgi:hypothetical protein